MQVSGSVSVGMCCRKWYEDCGAHIRQRLLRHVAGAATGEVQPYHGGHQLTSPVVALYQPGQPQ